MVEEANHVAEVKDNRFDQQDFSILVLLFRTSDLQEEGIQIYKQHIVLVMNHAPKRKKPMEKQGPPAITGGPCWSIIVFGVLRSVSLGSIPLKLVSLKPGSLNGSSLIPTSLGLCPLAWRIASYRSRRRLRALGGLIDREIHVSIERHRLALRVERGSLGRDVANFQLDMGQFGIVRAPRQEHGIAPADSIVAVEPLQRVFIDPPFLK